MHVTIGFKTYPQKAEWTAVDEMWAAIGQEPLLESVWLNDHLRDLPAEGGPSLEGVTLMAALAHRFPGKLLGHSVLSNTFRHPAMLAKQATLLDHVTGARFVLGLGAGGNDPEHQAFGIAFPPPAERFDRFESALEVLKVLFSSGAAGRPGVTRPDPFYPLDQATNEPSPLTPGGPPIWLGARKRRGIQLAVRFADGWFASVGPTPDIDDFRTTRDRFCQALEAAGRDVESFTFATQVHAGTSRAERGAALAASIEFVQAGANHVTVGVRSRTDPADVGLLVREIVEPLREQFA